jgi:hypothetical protein
MSKATGFSVVPNKHSDMRPIIEGVAAFVARCLSAANLKPIKARRQKTYALTSRCLILLGIA